MANSELAKRQAILVLGMHRSGTSALSGVLAQLGVQPPRTLMQPASDNPRGFWESKEIVAFHERLLMAIGSVWSDWWEIDDALIRSSIVAEHIARLSDLIGQEFEDGRLFFVKDPRMCRFPGVWLRALANKGIEAKAVIPIRHPAEVASSLECRNQLGTLRSRLMWLRHVLDAEHATRGVRRTIVLYASLLGSWRTEVERMGVELDVQWPVPPADAAPKIEEFLHAGLRHFSGEVGHESSGRLDEWVDDVYRLLQQLGRGQDQAVMQHLDDIRREFNLASSVFASVFRESESAHAGAMSDLRKQLEAKPADIAAAVERKLVAVESRIKSEHQADLSKLAASMRADAERHGAMLSALGDELRSRRHLADAMQARLREQDDELATLRRRFEQSNELYRQESAKRKAINAELERLVAEQGAALERNARKLRASKSEITGLGQELERLRTGHASEIATLQAELANQRRIAEQARNELHVLRSSRGWRMLNLFRRAVGRGKAEIADELAMETKSIDNSGLFDRRWYLDQYPDVANGGMDPVEHYLRFGASEMRNPNFAFDTRSYLDRYPDVRASGINPLVHYIRFGMREGRSCRADTPR